MKLRQKFMLLAGMIGVLVLAVSAIGFYEAYTNLKSGVEKELSLTMDQQEEELEGWLREKATAVEHMTAIRETLGESSTVADMREMQGLIVKDKEFLDFYYGHEGDGKVVFYYGGDVSDKMDPRERPWYKAAKSQDKLVFTEVYKDFNTGKYCVTIAQPYKHNGRIAGVTGADLSVDVLQEQAGKLNYLGEGTSYILEKNGTLLATNGSAELLTSVESISGLRDVFPEMAQNQQGFANIEMQGETQLVAYATVPSSGWIVALAVPEAVLYAPVANLKFIFVGLTIFALVLGQLACMKMAGQIVVPVSELEQHASQLSGGNLNLQELPVASEDEIGSMTSSFNEMSRHLRELIVKMSGTSEQVAAASQQLTANAQQSADSSIRIAEHVAGVNDEMEGQLADIDRAKVEVDTIFQDIGRMGEKAVSVQKSTDEMAGSAHEGAGLMEKAVAMMADIEQSVQKSEQMVNALGEQSAAIGQIVDSVSAIADQTNLLALNAAIEAARAGEAGKGFAVVAEEVRKLAAESQHAAENIKERISSIQQSTGRTVQVMEKGSATVTNGTEAIRRVGEQFQSIIEKIDNIKVQVTEIASAVDVVTDGAGNIVRAVDSIDSASRKAVNDSKVISAETQQQSASNEEIAAASQALATLAEEMQEAVNKFRV
ncbi:methyl-accepting chemotaxis protein [Anaerovibrio sp.]|uniref:methyl-accepting chemotaxis protein n=1 Tax=Anaerovibrio sp. TaxID=1872532 RepID=UPI003F13A886